MAKEETQGKKSKQGVKRKQDAKSKQGAPGKQVEQEAAPQNGGNVKKLVRVLGISVLIVLVLVAVVFFIDRQLHLFGDPPSPESSSDSLFYQTDPDHVRSIAAFDNGLAVLTNSELIYFDAGGREINTNKHSYAEPEMKINGKTLLLYDKGGTGYRIEKNASVYSEGAAPGIITCAVIGKMDNYAFSVDNDGGFQSHIFVYSAKGKLQFEWGSASDYCLNIALSDSGNKIAVCVVGVENAEYYSKVLMFTNNSSAAVYTVDLPGKTAYQIDFLSGRKIAVFTDSGVYSVDGEGSHTLLQSFSSAEITHSCVTSVGLRCTVVSPFGNEQAPLLTVFDEKNRILYQRRYREAITGVTCNGSFTAVLMGDHVEVVTRDNRISGDILPGETCEQYAIGNHSLYLLTGKGILKYNLHFDTEKARGTGTYSKPVSIDSNSGVYTTAVPESESDSAPTDIGVAIPTDTSTLPESSTAEEDDGYDYDDGDDYDYDYYDDDYDYDDDDDYDYEYDDDDYYDEDYD